MLSIRSSPTKEPNRDFTREPRQAGESNLEWFWRHKPNEDQPCLVLLGGKSALDFRLRAAQSQARHDATPSHWSHVAFLLAWAGAPATCTIHEISLQPVGGFGYPPVNNAVQETTLERYADAELWPNLAIIYLPVNTEDVLRLLDRFMFQRSALDAVELVVAWLGYAWGVGRAMNPLAEGIGLPSATMVEYILGGLQYELTPGLDSRSSCPEAIWQSAMWWHNYYEESGGRKLEGRWVVDHGLVDRKHRF